VDGLGVDVGVEAAEEGCCLGHSLLHDVCALQGGQLVLHGGHVALHGDEAAPLRSEADELLGLGFAEVKSVLFGELGDAGDEDFLL